MPLSFAVYRLPFYALTALLDSVDWNLKKKNVESFDAFAARVYLLTNVII